MTATTKQPPCFEEKEIALKAAFSDLPDRESIYKQILKWGQKLPSFDPSWKIDENRVVGCQSLMYLKTRLEEEKLFFAAFSDALISKGLAALLTALYNGEKPEVVLRKQPLFLKECGIIESLSPGRANGLASLYKKMQQEAIAAL